MSIVKLIYTSVTRSPAQLSGVISLSPSPGKKLCNSQRVTLVYPTSHFILMIRRDRYGFTSPVFPTGTRYPVTATRHCVLAYRNIRAVLVYKTHTRTAGTPHVA